ncbi:MAG: glycosyltransferase family 39 protein [Candidatus Micrarchaeota archaeon]
MINFNFNENKKLALCLAVFLAFSLTSFFLPFFSTDEYGYMASGMEIKEGTFANVGDINRFPLFPFMLSAVYSILGYSEFITKLLMLVIGILTIYIFHEKLAKPALGAEKAFLATLVFVSNPFFLYLSTRVLSEPLFFLLLITGIFLLTKFENVAYAFVFGIVSATLFLTRYIGVIILLVAALFLLWKHKNVFAIPVKSVICAVFGFVLALLPWFWLSEQTTGSFFALALKFFSQQSVLNEATFSLPDKIPFYLIFIPFLLLFATPLLWKGAADFYKRGIASNKTLTLAGITVVVFWLAMEVYGVFNVALLRYIVPIIPFLALFAGNVELPFKFAGFQINKKIFYSFIVLNLLIASGVFVFFASYPKYIGYKEAGQWAAENCASINSNIQKVMEHYSGKYNSIPAQCTVISGYDGALQPADDQTLVFESHGVKIYNYFESKG